MREKSIWLMLVMSILMVLAGCSVDDNIGSAGGTGNDIAVNGSEDSAGIEGAEDKGNGDKGSSESIGELGELKVHYIDVGQADATLLQATGDKGETYIMLIDTGDHNRTDAVDYLRGVGVTDIDVVVGTHPHADHIGQMDKVLQQFNVEEVWMSGDSANSQIYNRVLTAVESKDVGYAEPRSGDTYELGDMLIEILSPSDINGELNNGSIAMKVTYGNVRFIFTGDAEEKAENGILSRDTDIGADILKLGHHGSDTSTIQGFLEAVNPSVAIYSAGQGNSYGHPVKSVLDRVREIGSEVYGTDVNGTDVNGTVIVTTDGQGYTVAEGKTGEVVGIPKAEEKGTSEQDRQDSQRDHYIEGTENKVNGEGCININTATEQELRKIKHIGEVRSGLVIESRPYSSIDELIKVKGIGDARVQDIKDEGLACS